MTDFRALCARMADELDHYRQLLMDDRREAHALAAEARAALAQPEPQGPTDEELIQLAIDTRLYRFQATAGDSIQYEMTEQQVHAFARAALSRCGRQTIEPVPVSEILPGSEACDAEGRCWFFHTLGDEWFLSRLPKVGDWYRWQSVTHWLPYWALPVPKSEAGQ